MHFHLELLPWLLVCCCLPKKIFLSVESPAVTLL
ncbi:hypothetical protein GLYMA_09G178250v4 [Glycine max]|nr:hypothetical protein GLYMA_09G178250v4 [Glycine max]KAH1043533.1 hypothetical protein GYH30_025396 [Glycine max]